MLKLYYGTQAQYNALAVKDNESLYFITDTKKLYRGAVDFTDAARVVASMPASPAQGIVYFDQSDSKAKVFDGTNVQVISLPASTVVSASSTDDTVATSKAVYDAVKDLAPLASPALTGVPTAPTAAAGTDSTQIATTAFVKAACDDIQAALAGAFHFKGVVATVSDLPSTAVEGDVYQVTTTPSGSNAEYAFDGTNWVELGTVIDLSSYATQTFAQNAANTAEANAKAASDPAGSAAAAQAAAIAASDSKGSAAAAETAAKAYADSLASNYDAAGSATAAETAAKAYADSLASNYDAAGAAATAKADVIGASGDAASANTIYGAKAYADSVVGEAITWNSLGA